MNDKWKQRIMNFLPLFKIYIEIPYFRLRTDLMCYHWEMRMFYYYSLSIKFIKWHFEFEIFKPSFLEKN